MENKPRRNSVPKDTEATVLFKADHTCSICNDSSFGVQIAHIDKNRNNNKECNLIAICPNHHARIDSRSPITKSYTPLELKKYKKQWEKAVQVKRDSLENPQRMRLMRFDGINVNTVYLEVASGVLRAFQDGLTLELLGFNWGNVDIYPDSHKDKFEFEENLKKLSECTKVRAKFSNGTVANEVYVIWEDGKKHWVPDPETLNAIGGFKDIQDLDYLKFNSIPHGQRLLDIFQIRTKRLLQKSLNNQTNSNGLS